MTIDDPFATSNGDEGERTIIKPVPGGRRTAPAAPTPPPRPASNAAPSEPSPLSTRAGLNPLEAAAAPLLSLIMRLKNTSSHPDPEALRQRMIEEMKAFTVNARNQGGVQEKTAYRARYVLCTTLDEVVLNTPWGRASEWSENSLLVTFHNETWGGEKFFELLDAIILDPRKNLYLLELMYLCLAFGFQGRFKLLENGRSRLEEQRERVYNAIRTARGEFEQELSPHWRGVIDQRNPLIRYVPLWVVAAVAAALLLIAYALFSWLLNNASDPVFTALSDIRGETIAMVRRPGAQTPPAPAKPQYNTNLPQVTKDLRTFLDPQIRQGLVAVIEEADKTTIRIRGDGLFDSGSATIKPAFYNLLQQIGAELNKVQGRVLVTGHTDNVPIRTLKFPSNYDLSKARADSVMKILAANSANPGRFLSEGRAETDPIAANDTPQNRALNRRVDIVLLARIN